MSTTVLLTAHEPAIRGLLERQLLAHGFELAKPGADPDLVLAGDESGVARWRRQAPVIVLGPAEADPYQLVERMRAVLPSTGRSTPLVAGPLTIDRRARVVTVHDRRVDLSQKEYELLLRLAAEPERVFTRDELMRDIWDFRARTRSRTLDAHASRLRCKLRSAAPEAGLVDNVWGVGYRLFDPHSGVPP